ncbi:MAG: hypothetical protein ABJD11_04960 [Gemmatimonadota bacterium]
MAIDETRAPDAAASGPTWSSPGDPRGPASYEAQNTSSESHRPDTPASPHTYAPGAGESATGGAGTTFQEGKGRVIGQMDSVARAFRETAERLQGEDQGDLARYTERLSERVEQVSGYLREKNIGALLDDLEGLAHRRPEVFLGTAFALGLLGARFLKSSDRRQEGVHASS